MSRQAGVKGEDRGALHQARVLGEGRSAGLSEGHPPFQDSYLFVFNTVTANPQLVFQGSPLIFLIFLISHGLQVSARNS